jgi:hypothetical protein
MERLRSLKKLGVGSAMKWHQPCHLANGPPLVDTHRVQLAIRDIIGSLKIDEILEQRAALNQKLMDFTVSKAKELGINVQLIGIKDIMFPGELKKIFAKVVEAQKEGLAALERARGETAALRNLANVAKVLEDNPTLMQLRALQSTGNTVVFGVSGAIVPINKKVG